MLARQSNEVETTSAARDGGRPEYRANRADQQFWESPLRPKRCLLAIHVKLRKVVASKLILDGSPQQISGFRQLCSVICSASLSPTNERAIRNSPPPMDSQRTTRAAVV